MKRIIIACSLGFIAIGGVFLWPIYGSRIAAGDPQTAPLCIGGHCCCVLRHGGEGGIANAAQPTRPSQKEQYAPNHITLDPNQFFGDVKKAYQAAEANPALFAQLHCYCGCDVTAGHKNLLDCYRDHHGETCAICTGEALQAAQMNAEGSPVDQIQDALRRRFAGRE
ncbi:MAG TPA: CYCXC family (seleno)protein [Candidatus Binataceae bacterium]|nr:CYCXC family (seleno)protein [Candidatus Binataceae bacterium]